MFWCRSAFSKFFSKHNCLILQVVGILPSSSVLGNKSYSSTNFLSDLIGVSLQVQCCCFMMCFIINDLIGDSLQVKQSLSGVLQEGRFPGSWLMSWSCGENLTNLKESD